MVSFEKEIFSYFDLKCSELLILGIFILVPVKLDYKIRYGFGFNEFIQTSQLKLEPPCPSSIYLILNSIAYYYCCCTKDRCKTFCTRTTFIVRSLVRILPKCLLRWYPFAYFIILMLHLFLFEMFGLEMEPAKDRTECLLYHVVFASENEPPRTSVMDELKRLSKFIATIVEFEQYIPPQTLRLMQQFQKNVA